MTTRPMLIALGLFLLPACGGSPSETAAEGEDEAALSARPNRSIDTLLGAIQAAQTAGQGPATPKGTLLHSCHTRGVRPKVNVDVYVEKDVIEDAPGVVVVKAKGVDYAVTANVNLGKYGGAYQNDDASFDFEGVYFNVDRNDPEDYGSFKAAYFEDAELICTSAPKGWGP
jgi:hypothetical protein